MTRKQFLALLWKWFFLPLIFIGIGIFVANAFSDMVSGMELSDFTDAWIVIPFAAIIIISVLVLSYINRFIRKQYNRLPETIRHNLRRLVDLIRGITDWLFPFVIGALIYRAWTTGNKTLAMVWALTIVIARIRQYQNSQEQTETDVSTHTTP